MGRKGSKLSPEARAFQEEVVERLSPVGDVTSRSMFGGFGIFESGNMFALISKSTLYFKVDKTTKPNYEAAGSTQHTPMPYYNVPPDVFEDENKLHQWARDAIKIAHAAKNK